MIASRILTAYCCAPMFVCWWRLILSVCVKWRGLALFVRIYLNSWRFAFAVGWQGVVKRIVFLTRRSLAWSSLLNICFRTYLLEYIYIFIYIHTGMILAENSLVLAVFSFRKWAQLQKTKSVHFFLCRKGVAPCCTRANPCFVIFQGIPDQICSGLVHLNCWI